MSLRTGCALLLLVCACATTEPSPKAPAVARSPRLANLQHAAELPWRDEGRCVVQQASHPWEVVIERCYPALDTRRVRFHDSERRCTVASAGAGAAAAPALVGICLLSQPHILVGTVVIVGVVVVGIVIKEELEAYGRRGRAHPEKENAPAPPRPTPQPRPTWEREVSATPRPEPGGAGSTRDPHPPLPVQPRRPECEPVPVPHLGGHDPHNRCADNVPFNDFRGYDALVNGKHFDAVQLGRRVLWEIKTDNFDTYTPELQDIVIDSQVPKLQRERELASACGFDFWVGVRSAAHKAALLRELPTLNIVVMDWC